MMKKKQPVKSLAITVETIRKLGVTQLGAVVGASNNGCGSSTSHQPTLCLACQF
jgi:hypothetical protein